MIEFKEFPKIARLSRECVVTEKLDGTNAQIYIGEDGEFLVGSRTRWITPDDDNYGFARWAYERKDELMKLGKGQHFGEWWGGGIQRAYGLQKDDKRFSMFNTIRWALYGTTPQRIITGDPKIERYQDVLPECCGLVPVLYRGMFSTPEIMFILEQLREGGSKAVRGFMRPEGIVVFHIAANFGFKKTLEKDEQPKSLSNQRG